MVNARASLAIACLTIILATTIATHYDPTWDSLDNRPLPAWFDEAKFGIFIHWGVFSVPSFGTEWFWNRWSSGEAKFVQFMKNNYRPDFTYADFAADFTAEFYDPKQWADIFKASGAKYVVLTSKHHEGFCNWATNVSFNWNSVAVGPKRDLVGDLAEAIRSTTDLRFGVYHSLFEWFNPMYLQDEANNFTTQKFVKAKTMPELYELVNQYQPEIIWSDGCNAPPEYWTSREFLAWLYNDSPVKDTIVVNDRWCSPCICEHGGYYTCGDRYNPGKLQPHKWESCMTIDSKSWGYRREAVLNDYLTIEKLITNLVKAVSCNGNLLLNVGPTHDGRIVPIFEERLRQMGEWLKVNGEAIYKSKPWTHQNDTVTPDVWYTSQRNTKNETVAVYATVLDWPKGNLLRLGAPPTTTSTRVTMLGYRGEMKWQAWETGVEIQIPPMEPQEMPCKWAWVFKMEDLKQSVAAK